MSVPAPPEGARLVYDDGTVVPLELYYTGRDADGVEVWRATAAVDLDDVVRRGAVLRFDVLPANCAVTFRAVP